jgi:hypothetical protein
VEVGAAEKKPPVDRGPAVNWPPVLAGTAAKRPPVLAGAAGNQPPTDRGAAANWPPVLAGMAATHQRGWNPPAMCLCDPAPPYLPSAPAPPAHPAPSVPCASFPLSAAWRPAAACGGLLLSATAAACVGGEGWERIYLGLIRGVARAGVDSRAKARQKSSGSSGSI